MVSLSTKNFLIYFLDSLAMEIKFKIWTSCHDKSVKLRKQYQSKNQFDLDQPKVARLFEFSFSVRFISQGIGGISGQNGRSSKDV